MSSGSQLFYELTTIYRPFINQLDKELNQYHLFSSQWRIMKFLLDQGPHTLSEIAYYSHVEKPTITRLVQKLSDLGYVEATTREDKRVKLIQLTDSGHAVCNEVLKSLEVFYQYLLEDIDEDTQQAMYQSLKRIAKKLKEY